MKPYHYHDYSAAQASQDAITARHVTEDERDWLGLFDEHAPTPDSDYVVPDATLPHGTNDTNRGAW